MNIKKNYIIILFLIIFLTGCSDVKSTILSESIAPNDDNITAVVIEKDSGMTTAYNYQVAIVKGKEHSENIEGNIFKGSHLSDVKLEWKDNNLLIIYFSAIDPTIDLQKEKFEIDNKIIKIEYIISNE